MVENNNSEHLRISDLTDTFLQNIDHGVIVLDSDLNVIFWNRWLQIRLNISYKDIKEKNIISFFPNIKEKTLRRKINTALNLNAPTYYTAESSHYFIPIKQKNIIATQTDSDYMDQDVTILAFDKEKKHVILVITDQSIMVNRSKELKSLNESIKRQQEQLIEQSRNAAMGEMISMIAHQWRQPLSLINTIMATVQLEYDLDTLDKVLLNRSFDKIEQTVHFLSSTINDFKDYFKPQKEKQSISLNQTILKSVSFLEPTIKVLGVNYICNSTDIHFLSYSNELVQVVINLIKNSLDAIQDNEIKDGEIIVETVEEQDSVLIIIRDNAGGIPSENIERIFEPYFSTKSKNGTGLGLYMVKMIVEKHLLGSVSVVSLKNESIFTLKVSK